MTSFACDADQKGGAALPARRSIFLPNCGLPR
jgi:hypothetical protein